MMRIEQPVFAKPEVMGQMQQAARVRTDDVTAANRLALDVAARIRQVSPDRAAAIHRLESSGLAKLLEG